MSRFDHFLGRCLAATRDFSRIPVPASAPPQDAAGNARHWPGVGLVLGLAAALVFALVSLPLPAGALSPLVAAIAATGVTVLLTDSRHENELLRQAGTVGLVLVLAAKLALLAVIGAHSPAGVLAALLAAQVVSRLWALLLAWSLPPATPARDAKHPLREPADRGALGAGLLWCLVPAALMVLATGVPFLLFALLASGVAFAELRRRARGGVTLDAVGTAQQLCEVAFYLGAAFGVPR